MALAAQHDTRLICFDLDGTLVDQTIFIWSTLHEYFGSDPLRRQQAAEDFHAGRISYHDWFHNDLTLLREKGAQRDRMIKAIEPLRPTLGAHETLARLSKRGYRLAVISGSLDLVLQHFFPQAPFAHVLINQIHFDADGNIAGGIPTPYDLEGKARGLTELARREGISTADCAFIGDNVNDLPVMKKAGFAIGVNIKSPKVAEVADLVLERTDLRQLLAYFPGPSLKS